MDLRNKWSEPLVLWPSRQRTLSGSIPEQVRDEPQEARTCFNAKAYRATAVMVRRSLEAFCADQGVVGRMPLNRSLAKLAESNTIDPRLLEWAHGLRAIGNDGAHFTGALITREDAVDALELAEAVLDYVYVFGARYEAFKARRAAKDEKLGSNLADEAPPF